MATSEKLGSVAYVSEVAPGMRGYLNPFCLYSVFNEHSSIAPRLPYILGDVCSLGSAGLIGVLVWVQAHGKGFDLRPDPVREALAVRPSEKKAAVVQVVQVCF